MGFQSTYTLVLNNGDYVNEMKSYDKLLESHNDTLDFIKKSKDTGANIELKLHSQVIRKMSESFSKTSQIESLTYELVKDIIIQDIEEIALPCIEEIKKEKNLDNRIKDKYISSKKFLEEALITLRNLLIELKRKNEDKEPDPPEEKIHWDRRNRERNNEINKLAHQIYKSFENAEKQLPIPP